MHLLREEPGSATLLAAVSMVVLLGFLSLAIDVGGLRVEKQRLQMAADAAALAAALEVSYCTGGTQCAVMNAAAQDALTENGMTGSTVLNNCAAITPSVFTVEVNHGPCALGSSDPNAGNSSYVEVIVSEYAKTKFAGLFGIDNVLIQARSEAGLGHSPYCLYAMGAVGTDVTVNGSATLNFQNCGMILDSVAGSALMVNGTVKGAGAINIVGSYVLNGGGSLSPAPATGSAAAADPLASLPAPTFNTSSCLSNPNLNSGSHTIGPSASGGTICYNGLTIGGSGTITLTPGIYVINGALILQNSGTISGTGVTFYLPPGGSYTDNGNGGKLSVAAPTSGTYDGILIFQSRLNSQQLLFNAATTSSIQGIVYAPAAQLVINGSSSASNPSTLYTGVITSSMILNGSATFANYASVNASSPLVSGAMLSQ